MLAKTKTKTYIDRKYVYIKSVKHNDNSIRGRAFSACRKKAQINYNKVEFNVQYKQNYKQMHKTNV